MKVAEDLGRKSLLFEQNHNSRYRYSKLKGKTPLAVFQQSLDLIRFPDSDTAPRHPLPKPAAGRYHLVRFIRSNALLDVFGEQFPLPAEAVYAYGIATVDAGRPKLLVENEDLPGAGCHYRL